MEENTLNQSPEIQIFVASFLELKKKILVILVPLLYKRLLSDDETLFRIFFSWLNYDIAHEEERFTG